MPVTPSTQQNPLSALRLRIFRGPGVHRLAGRTRTLPYANRSVARRVLDNSIRSHPPRPSRSGRIHPTRKCILRLTRNTPTRFSIIPIRILTNRPIPALVLPLLNTPLSTHNLPKAQKGPIIVLPVPDPQVFPLLIHYMYHGPTARRTRWSGPYEKVKSLGKGSGASSSWG